MTDTVPMPDGETVPWQSRTQELEAEVYELRQALRDVIAAVLGGNAPEISDAIRTHGHLADKNRPTP